MKGSIARLCALFVAPALLATGTAAAEVYQWRDAAGRLHYSDQAPASANYERFEAASGIADNPTPPPAKRQTQQLMDDGAPEECAEAREKLQSYRDAENIVESSALGEERELNEAEREKLIGLQQQAVARACG